MLVDNKYLGGSVVTDVEDITHVLYTFKGR